MIELSYSKNSSNKKIFINPDDNNINAAIEHLKSKTGIYIDPYGDTKLYPSHQKIIVSFLTNHSNVNLHIDLLDYLKKSIELDETIYCKGD